MEGLSKMLKQPQTGKEEKWKELRHIQEVYEGGGRGNENLGGVKKTSAC